MQAGNQIGKLLTDVKSPDGDPIGQMVIKAADEQGAWVDYSYLDPVTDRVEHKFSWVVLHDGKIFGCGIYVPSH
jgi:signal transduction histidine kinase